MNRYKDILNQQEAHRGFRPASVLLNIGAIHQLQGNTKVAIELYRKIIYEHAAKPHIADCKLQKNVEVKVHFNLGTSLMQENLLMVARAHFAHVLKLDSTHKLARVSMDMIRTTIAMEAKHESAGASVALDDFRQELIRSFFIMYSFEASNELDRCAAELKSATKEKMKRQNSLMARMKRRNRTTGTVQAEGQMEWTVGIHSLIASLTPSQDRTNRRDRDGESLPFSFYSHFKTFDPEGKLYVSRHIFLEEVKRNGVELNDEEIWDLDMLFEDGRIWYTLLFAEDYVQQLTGHKPRKRRQSLGGVQETANSEKRSQLRSSMQDIPKTAVLYQPKSLAEICTESLFLYDNFSPSRVEEVYRQQKAASLARATMTSVVHGVWTHGAGSLHTQLDRKISSQGFRVNMHAYSIVREVVSEMCMNIISKRHKDIVTSVLNDVINHRVLVTVGIKAVRENVNLQPSKPTNTDELFISIVLQKDLSALRRRMCRRIVYETVLSWYRRLQEIQRADALSKDQNVQYKLWEAAKKKENEDKRLQHNQKMAERLAVLEASEKLEKERAHKLSLIEAKKLRVSHLLETHEQAILQKTVTGTAESIPEIDGWFASSESWDADYTHNPEEGGDGKAPQSWETRFYRHK
jgi:tetratricopeptide (TPR) repeat protein